ncbi:MAG: ammonia-forming cytochrome c nitrite reductase subunit c552, partial [bacterium]|nr:ammonia-forming cytochrome c nitrite reductase subunit c552 [bacterium]
QVKAFQELKKQKMVDIYIPIKEQFATSGHTETLKHLRESDEVKEPRCYQCMSADYFLAPPDQKPDPKTLKLSITCAVCHEMDAAEFKLRLDPLETCTTCHNNGGEIVVGETLHHPQKEMFLGYGAIGVTNTPDIKYTSGLTCIECHMPNEAHTFKGLTPADALKEHSESICVMCHADQSEEQFAKEVAKMQGQIEDSCQRLEKSLRLSQEKMNNRKKKGQDISQAQAVYNIVYTNLSFVVSDGSKGVHNFGYSTKIMKYTEAKNKELEKMLK